MFGWSLLESTKLHDTFAINPKGSLKFAHFQTIDMLLFTNAYYCLLSVLVKRGPQILIGQFESTPARLKMCHRIYRAEFCPCCLGVRAGDVIMLLYCHWLTANRRSSWGPVVVGWSFIFLHWLCDAKKKYQAVGMAASSSLCLFSNLGKTWKTVLEHPLWITMGETKKFTIQANAWNSANSQSPGKVIDIKCIHFIARMHIVTSHTWHCEHVPT